MPSFVLFLILSTLVPTLMNLQWPAGWDARIFVAVAMLGHLGLAAVVCCAPAWVCLRLESLRPFAVPVAAVLASAWLIVVLIDARVYQVFGFHLNGLVVGLLLQGGLLQQLGVSSWMWSAVIAVSACIVLLNGWVATRLSRMPRLRWVPGARSVACLLPLIVISQGAAIWYDATARGDALAPLQAVPWMHTATARSAMEKLGLAQLAGRADHLQAQGPQRSALNYPRTPMQCQAQTPMNVVLLVVDSLRYDMVDPVQMPHVARFAEQSWRAERHYSTGNNTMHGMFGLFYGLPGLHVDTMIHHRRGPELLLQLASRGYQFHLYGGASLQGARLDRAVFVQTDADLQTAPSDAPRDRRDRNVIDRLRSDLAAQDPQRPFFALALLDSAHAPYAVPASAERRFLPQARSGDHVTAGRRTDPLPLFNRYRNAVLKADALLGDVLRTLDETGLTDSTVVIITSDHGESFNDLGQNDWGHNSNFSDSQVRVPMLIRWPGRAPADEPAVTSHMDLVPTLMRHLLQCMNPVSDYAAGLDLFARLPGQRPLLVESWTSRAVRLGPDTLLLRPYGIEIRDGQYRTVAGGTVLDDGQQAAIIEQIQPFQ